MGRLPDSHLSSIAVIGPNAKVAQIMGGGSAQVNAHDAITPFDAITARAGDSVSVRYEQGCTNYKDKNPQLHSQPSSKPTPRAKPTPLPGIWPPLNP